MNKELDLSKGKMLKLVEELASDLKRKRQQLTQKILTHIKALIEENQYLEAAHILQSLGKL